MEVSRQDIYKLERLLRDFHLKPEVRERFKRDPDAVLREYEVPEYLGKLAKEGRVRTLYQLGVHQLLLYHLGHVLGIKPEEYVRRMHSPEY